MTYIYCDSIQNVIFLDGHASHTTNLEFLQICKNSNKNIKVVVFPAGQTATLQPLDESVFGGVKGRWRRHIRDLNVGWHKDLPHLSRNTFPHHLVALFGACKLSETLRSGFLQTGLSPFSPQKIRATVSLVSVVGIFPPSPEFTSPKRRIMAALKEMRDSPDEIAVIMDEVDRFSAGMSPAKFAAQAYKTSLIQPCPPKRARKEARMSTKAGEIMTDSGRMKFLEERLAAKAKEAEEKTVSKSNMVSVPKKAPQAKKPKSSRDVL